MVGRWAANSKVTVFLAASEKDVPAPASCDGDDRWCPRGRRYGDDAPPTTWYCFFLVQAETAAGCEEKISSPCPAPSDTLLVRHPCHWLSTKLRDLHVSRCVPTSCSTHSSRRCIHIPAQKPCCNLKSSAEKDGGGAAPPSGRVPWRRPFPPEREQPPSGSTAQGFACPEETNAELRRIVPARRRVATLPPPAPSSSRFDPSPFFLCVTDNQSTKSESIWI